MIVATSRSRYGGKCQDVNHEGRKIAKGDPIYKVGTQGKSTPQGQGPGYWVCEPCSNNHDNDR